MVQCTAFHLKLPWLFCLMLPLFCPWGHTLNSVTFNQSPYLMLWQFCSLEWRILQSKVFFNGEVLLKLQWFSHQTEIPGNAPSLTHTRTATSPGALCFWSPSLRCLWCLSQSRASCPWAEYCKIKLTLEHNIISISRRKQWLRAVVLFRVIDLN